MPKYRKKPVVIEARRVPLCGEVLIEDYLDTTDEIAEWSGGVNYMMRKEGEASPHVSLPDVTGPHIVIPTLEGAHAALPGDYVIQGVQGEFYPCKSDIFAETYEEVY